jgi:hypothetical protein
MARPALLFRYGNPVRNIIPVVPRRESARASSVVAVVRVARAVLVLALAFGEMRR